MLGEKSGELVEPERAVNIGGWSGEDHGCVVGEGHGCRGIS